MEKEREEINELLHRAPDGSPPRPSEGGPTSEPMPQDELPDEMFDDGGTPLSGHGEVRGDQQAQYSEARFGGLEKGVKHRGRS
jgi:hypothetical protein